MKPQRIQISPVAGMRVCRWTCSLVVTLAFIGPNAARAGSGAEPISVESLLNELIDRDALARWPEPSYTCRQASSFDRAKIAPDKPGWFANADFSNYIRSETNGGRKEWVMMDADGPGAIVRWWGGLCTPTKTPGGIMRIYIDNQPEPVFQGTFDDLVTSGRWGKPPLAAVTCIGRNYYFPIPYAQHCKVTYDRPPPKEDTENRKGEELVNFYAINYRTYAKGTLVESFSAAKLQKAQPVAERVSRILTTPANESLAEATWQNAETKRLMPKESLSQSFGSPQAIRRLSVQLKAADMEQALRSTVLVITCDGEQTVWCPVGDFFGSGVGLNPYRDWWREVDRNGLMTCYWVMPFRHECHVELQNMGKQPVEATLGAIARTNFDWDEHSMHFHAGWRQQSGIETKAAEGTADWNYVTLTGRGIYVGDTLALHNGSSNWWGEGDEKVWVDGEKFPSHVGTGTEDYYGFSFGDKGTFFESPFHAEPRWDGNNKPGFVTVTRSRILDGIPFEKSLKFDMEIWHWAHTRVTYAATTYWYAQPGGKSNHGPMDEEANRPIVDIAREGAAEKPAGRRN